MAPAEASPRAAGPSWMERMRPSLKKNRARAGAEPVGAERMADLAGDLTRVSVSPVPRARRGDGASPSPPQARAGSGGGGGGASSPPFLGERANSGSTLSALQRLGSSGLFELASAVFGHDSMDAMRTKGEQGELGGSPLKAAHSVPPNASPPHAAHARVDL